MLICSDGIFVSTLQNGKDDDGEIQEDNSKSSEGLSSTVKPPPCGVVVGVIRRNWRAYCGALQASKRYTPTPHEVTHI